jgi:hypothetical protein
MTAKKNKSAAPAPQQPELPKVQDVPPPKADPPVKFLSLSSHDGVSHEFPTAAGNPHRVVRKGSGSSSGQGSAGIPVGPVTGPEDDSSGRDQGMAPTAASLAGVQQGGLYRDSNSFRQWASAAHAQGQS